MKYTKILLSLFGLSLFLFPHPVFAYVDPGTGSYVVQLILAFVFGGLFGIKMYWKKVKSFFVKSEKKKENDVEEEK